MDGQMDRPQMDIHLEDQCEKKQKTHDYHVWGWGGGGGIKNENVMKKICQIAVKLKTH